jgi:hypothetical protein
LNDIIHAKSINNDNNEKYDNKHLDYIYDNNEILKNKNKKMYDYSPEISEELTNLYYLKSRKNDSPNHENVGNTVNYLCNENLDDDDNDNDDDDDNNNGDDNNVLAIKDSEHYNNTTVHYDGNKYYYRNNNDNDNDDSDDDNKSEHKYGK